IISIVPTRGQSSVLHRQVLYQIPGRSIDLWLANSHYPSITCTARSLRNNFTTNFDEIIGNPLILHKFSNPDTCGTLSHRTKIKLKTGWHFPYGPAKPICDLIKTHIPE